jgi:hypothetical protein
MPSYERYTTLLWCWECDSGRQASLPVTCQAASITQPDRLTWSCDHVGVTNVERPDPKGLSTFSQCTELLPHREYILMICMELSALTKWVVWVSRQASLHMSHKMLTFKDGIVTDSSYNVNPDWKHIGVPCRYSGNTFPSRSEITGRPGSNLPSATVPWQNRLLSRN